MMALGSFTMVSNNLQSYCLGEKGKMRKDGLFNASQQNVLFCKPAPLSITSSNAVHIIKSNQIPQLLHRLKKRGGLVSKCHTTLGVKGTIDHQNIGCQIKSKR